MSGAGVGPAAGAGAGSGRPPAGGPEGRPGASGPTDGRAPETGRREAELREVANRLEAVFVERLFQAMRETVPSQGGAAAQTGRDFYMGMMDEHLAKTLAERMDRGLGRQIFRELRRGAGPTGADGAGDGPGPSPAGSGGP